MDNIGNALLIFQLKINLKQRVKLCLPFVHDVCSDVAMRRALRKSDTPLLFFEWTNLGSFESTAFRIQISSDNAYDDTN